MPEADLSLYLFFRRHASTSLQYSDEDVSVPMLFFPGLSSVQLTVRSSVDPFIDAMGRTNNSGNFGSTSKEELVVGLVLIGVALLLSIPLIAHVYTVRTSQQIELLSKVDRDGEWSELNKLQRDNL